MQKSVVIIGAGPAGLTAAFEMLSADPQIKITILEADNCVGGISRTVNYKGNRMDIGGHRFFSKSDRVMKWWADRMPFTENEKNAEDTNEVMLIRSRLSRIFFLRKLFSYPISLSLDTINKLGLKRLVKIGFSYIKIRLFPIKTERHLEDFFINRFGKELYSTFFKDYTEKVWGVPCTDISPSWGAQRIKGISISSAFMAALKKLAKSSDTNDIAQKNVETSLIESFLYPKYGPGQMWEITAEKVKEMGAQLIFNHKVVEIEYEKGEIKSVTTTDSSGDSKNFEADYFISTMAIKDLIAALGEQVPSEVRDVAAELPYRDFLTVGLLCNKLKLSQTTGESIKDNWIYIQEPDVKIGRLQVFNNWSPYLVKDQSKMWIGLEYFVQEGDELWSKSDQDMAQFGEEELIKIGILDSNDVLDSVVIKMPKTYPSYIGRYSEFHVVKDFVNSIKNIFLIGRNGQHRYNNQDHSMLTAMVAAEQILSGEINKDLIWKVNTEEVYHEKK